MGSSIWAKFLCLFPSFLVAQVEHELYAAMQDKIGVSVQVQDTAK